MTPQIPHGIHLMYTILFRLFYYSPILRLNSRLSLAYHDEENIG